MADIVSALERQTYVAPTRLTLAEFVRDQWLPMPEWPPVTIARFPDKSIPPNTSAAVLCAPNPDPILC